MTGYPFYYGNEEDIDQDQQFMIFSLESVSQNMGDEAPTKIKFECESMQESDLLLPDQTGINEKEEF